MAAVIGLSDEKVRLLCGRASWGENSIVVPANYNAPEQVVIAGHTEAVDRAAEISSGKQFYLVCRNKIFVYSHYMAQGKTIGSFVQTLKFCRPENLFTRHSR